MARSYTSKDTKELLNFHKENLRQLHNGASLPIVYNKKIKKAIDEMLSRNVFVTVARNEIVGNQNTNYSEINGLIYLLYQYELCLSVASKCESVLTENEERISQSIKEASTGSNGFLWFFSSAKKKERAESAFELLQYEREGLFVTSSKEIFDAVEQIKNKTVSEAISDFRSSQKTYFWNLQRIDPYVFQGSDTVRELSDVASKIKWIRHDLDDAKANIDKTKEQIKAATERMVMSTVLDLLRAIPVEEINREKRGFRVKALRDAGFLNMADLYAASVYQLSSIYGISEDASYLIKRIAKKFAIETRKEAKIKLSTDNKTKDSSNLVEAIFLYRKQLDAIEKINSFNEQYDKKVNDALKNLDSVKNGVPWMFFTDQAKEGVKASFRFLSDLLKGEYKSTADSLLNALNKPSTETISEKWNDFENNSIAYFNILEEIVPGVLGNDDQLYGLPEELAREIQEECFFPEGLNCELRRYQEWGVKYILHQERVLLGDEMGLGKTVQAIAAMVSLRNTGATHFIVVCPASVLPNWCKEIATKSKLRVTKVHGPGRNTAIKSWLKTGGVAVTTYETTGIFVFEDGFNFDLLVVDEAHFIKNTRAVRSRNVRKICDYTNRILFMTGTPLENKVEEMISLIEVLQPSIARKIEGITFLSMAPQFREKIAPVYYRRKREEVLTELPDLIESKEWCELSEKEEKIYEQDTLDKNYMATRRLSWNVDDLNDSCKARRMLEIIDEAEADGRKILVFSFFLETLRKIAYFLGDRCLSPINGSVAPQRRQEIIDEFNDAPAGTVLCAQIQSGGTGLNIQAASVVIICEPQFKPSIENQAISRAYRMGQARNVLVYRLLCENTIDEKITSLLEEKQRVFDAFADKSVAAANAEKVEKEIDEKTFGKIIEEEIERIKAKHGNQEPIIRDESMFKGAQVSRPRATRIHSTLETDEPPARSALTFSEEYSQELSMTYDALVQHLLKKYGRAKGDYFLTETCATKNKKIMRGSEGLYCHHIDEDKAIMLSNPEYAYKNSFEYQKANRLVYCNVLEHLLLHIKIAEEPRKGGANRDELPGIGGTILICKPINDYFNGFDFRQSFQAISMSFISNNFEDYIRMLKYLWKVIEKNPEYSTVTSKRELASGWYGNLVEKVYNHL